MTHCSCDEGFFFLGYGKHLLEWGGITPKWCFGGAKDEVLANPGLAIIQYYMILPLCSSFSQY
jgi:hypothetical protein